MNRHQLALKGLLLAAIPVLVIATLERALAQTKGEKPVSALVTDVQGVETDVKNLLFYWEEKVSETAFVPHEQRLVPVKRGTATINVKFEHIRSIEIGPGPDSGPPLFTITLTNGKSGEFPLAIAGSFKGESDFGDLTIPATNVRRILVK